MSAPQRIQLRRTKGWRLPEGTQIVDRRTRWGNWYVVERQRQVVTWPDPDRLPNIARTGPWTVLQTRRKWPTGTEYGGFTDKLDATAFAVELHRRALLAMMEGLDGPHSARFYLGPLYGRDLACWCKPGDPCHADTLIELANSELVRSAVSAQ